MQVTVFHKDRETNEFTNVATIDCGDRTGTAALEYAYFRTQNIEGSWSKPYVFTWKGEEVINDDYSADITVNAELPERNGIQFGLRSSMMGDRFYCEEGSFECAMFGFEEIEVMTEENVVETNELNDDEMAAIGVEIIKQAATKKITPAKKGSKKAVVASIIAEIGLDDRKALVERIMTALNVTKANAGVYIYNYKKAQ